MLSSKKYFGPISIGHLCLRNNLISAPMAGLSSLPYRLLALEQGSALVFSEMVSAEGIIRAHTRTKHYFENDPNSRPFGVQVFGANPDSIAEAIRILEGYDIDLIDINMGCPVHKVCSKGAGAALMKDARKAREIIVAARLATKRPLTVKFRAGWDADSINCTEIARIVEDAGADSITIHPRTRQEMFKGRADWRHIAAVKRAVRIPVIGNGDVKCRADAIRLIEETSCDGVMIGRAAVGNPWIFSQILNETGAPPTLEERGKAAQRHIDLLCSLLGERKALMNIRAILPCYGKGIRGVKRFLQEAHGAKNISGLTTAVRNFFGK